jgi:hypothetical protein
MTVTTPSTEAGRELLGILGTLRGTFSYYDRQSILAIEAQARADADLAADEQEARLADFAGRAAWAESVSGARAYKAYQKALRLHLAENKRLRAALRQIAATPNLKVCQSAARIALQELIDA